MNRLSERDLQVIGQLAQDAVRWSGSHKSPIQGVRLRIAWTGLTKYDWNYVVPDVQRGRDDQSTQFPTVRDLFEKQLKAKTIFDIAIPDTPYSFKLVNGDVTPFFFDQEKYVLWQIVGLDREFHVMRKAATSSKTITFSAEGGDCEDLLTLDFSDRDHAPKITYYRRFDPP